MARERKNASSTRRSGWANGQRVAFLAIELRAGFDADMSGIAAAKYYHDWQNLVNLVNFQSPTGMRLAIQASPVWVKMEVETEFLRGTICACGVATLCALLAIVVFVQDIRTTTIATLSIVGMLLSVLALLVLRREGLGVVEALSMAVVVGMSVDYVVHLAHAYNHSVLHSRRGRSRSALISRGCSVVGAAATTCGASVFLLFC
jgi:multidrug efflux pump subunit AcrB